MYEPRRVAEGVVPLASLTTGDSATAAAFRSAPRRAQRTLGDHFRDRLGPSVALTMAATVGAIAMTPRAEASVEATAPVAQARVVDAVSRDLMRPATTETDTPASVPAKTAVAVKWSSAFGKVVGTRYAQSSLNVRAQADSDAKALGKLDAGDKVQVTDRKVGQYREIVHAKKVAWVLDAELGKKAPAKEAPATASSKGATSGAAKYTGSTTYSGKRVLGLTSRAMVVYNAVMSRWGGQINSVGGYRSSSRSDHQYGRAIDFMLTPGRESAMGWSIAKFLAANAGTLKVDHIIFEQKIWTPYRPYWRPMENRGSITQNHYDHVHVSVE